MISTRPNRAAARERIPRLLSGTLLAVVIVGGLAPRDAHAQQNLALNKPTTGSLPCAPTETSDKAVNGSVSGGNSDKWCTAQPSKVLTVDLGVTAGLTSFVVRHAGAGGEGTNLNTRDFNIQLSTNGTTFGSPVVTVTGNTASVTTHNITATLARFVRLTVVAGDQTGNAAAHARIYELEVFAADANPRPNIARNKAATGSAPCRAGEEPAKAVNGSVTGGNSDKFCSKVPPRFLEVNLGQDFNVDQVVIRHAGAGGESADFNTRNFTIEIRAADGTVARTVTVTNNTANVTTHNFPATRGRSIRLNVSTPTQNTNASMRIYELEAAGTPAGGQDGCDSVITTWQEHWFEHNLLIRRVACNEHAAIFFDDDVDRAQIGWILSQVSRQWQYFKQTYGSFGPDPHIYSIHHQGRFFGGHPDTRFGDNHDFRNVSDIGVSSWVESGGNHDIASHEICHVVEGSSDNVHESPAFAIWGDSKWAEFCQFDLYTNIGQPADAARVKDRFMATRDNFPRANTAWFRDWFFPLWQDHGGAQVMVRFFALLAQHFPKTMQSHGGGPSHLHYTRSMNLGEFVHFMSGAAGTNLSGMATTAFGAGTQNWEANFQKARTDFPGIVY